MAITIFVYISGHSVYKFFVQHKISFPMVYNMTMFEILENFVFRGVGRKGGRTKGGGGVVK